MHSAFTEILDIVKKEKRRNSLARVLFAQKTTSRINALERRLTDTLSLFQVTTFHLLPTYR